METYEQKYEKMKCKVIDEIGEEKFNQIKDRILYLDVNGCFYLCKIGNEHRYEFYNSIHDHLTSGFGTIVSSYA